MRKLITRKNAVLFFGVISLVLYFFLSFKIQQGACDLWLDTCIFLLYSIKFFTFFILLFIAHLLFSKKILVSLMKFVFAWSFLSLLFFWIGRNPGFVFPGINGMFFLCSFVLLLMSFFLILIKSWEFKALDRGVPVNIWLERLLFVIAFVISILLSIVLYGFM
jgi:hypothetical protein